MNLLLSKLEEEVTAEGKVEVGKEVVLEDLVVHVRFRSRTRSKIARTKTNARVSKSSLDLLVVVGVEEESVLLWVES